MEDMAFDLFNYYGDDGGETLSLLCKLSYYFIIRLCLFKFSTVLEEAGNHDDEELEFTELLLVASVIFALSAAHLYELEKAAEKRA